MIQREARIAVFFSKGRMFRDVLKHVRAYASGARTVAIVPKSYPMTSDERALAHEVVRTEFAQYSWRRPMPLLRLMRDLRRARYDALVITFDSPRLRMVASMSGALQCFYCRMDGKLIPIEGSLLGTIADTVARLVRGRVVYMWIWLVVRCLRVRDTHECSR